MKTRRAHSKKSGFTIVELIIVIAVIGILAAISVIAYNNVQKTAADKTMKSDLDQVTSEMQRSAIANAGVYPTTLPTTIQSSPKVTLTLKHSGTLNYYGANGTLSAVQNGVLMSQICQDLINEGAGKGVNQGGVTKDFITGCGNWNHGSMQITGWDSKVYNTPVSDTALLNYADNFTSNDTYNIAQVAVIQNFYHELVDRQTREGGYYPITSFWDSWATSSNGGVMTQALPTAQAQPWYCVEATYSSYSDLKWHVTDDLKLRSGGC
ncbi:MAG TPA: type II secretion system protein [Candidatus Microsaccharimonas sp.]|jgi:prepilin-type N-terminal cleavage/methylation domain-containing protein